MTSSSVETPSSVGAPAIDPIGSDPLEAAAARAGFQLVDAYERLGFDEAGRIFEHELNAWFEYARATVENLTTWESVASKLSSYENDNNRLRMRRVLDFLAPGERVFDVGFGRGYLCGVLLRDGKIDAYHGIDIVPANVTATNEMIAANGFADAPVTLELGDLYELTREKVASTGAGFMICCEVLEHVPEPERALRVLADALPDGVDLLFSVPLNGRLESVWGHVTVFDVHRIKAMVRQAGLTVHHIEPIANAWTIVIASRDPGPSPRIRAAMSRPLVDVSEPLSEGRDFIPVLPADLSPWSKRASTKLEPVRYQRTHCHVRARRRYWGYGGVSFGVPSLTAMRLDLDLLDSKARRVIVDATWGGRRIARWAWRPKDTQKTTQFSFRENFATLPFRRTMGEDLAGIDGFRVFVQMRPGRKGTFSVRAAYLP